MSLGCLLGHRLNVVFSCSPVSVLVRIPHEGTACFRTSSGCELKETRRDVFVEVVDAVLGFTSAATVDVVDVGETIFIGHNGNGDGDEHEDLRSVGPVTVRIPLPTGPISGVHGLPSLGELYTQGISTISEVLEKFGIFGTLY